MKSYKINYTPAAIEHIRKISLWYNEQKAGLGNRFKANLKKKITGLKKNPATNSYRYDEVRFVIPQSFPYAAHYTVEENTVIIHAVFGFKESPDKWEK